MSQAPILVTGGSGFVGSYLIALLEAAGRRVVALGQPPQPVVGAPLPPAIHPTWHDVDLRDREMVDDLIADLRPAEVYHLAGLASVADSFLDPAPAYQVNMMGTLYVLDAVRRFAPTARVLVVSSAEVYGGLTSPLTEDCPFYPGNPYAASKVGAEMVAVEQFRSHGLQVVRARAFNHTGPGQVPRFAIPSFAKQIAEIEAGRQSPVLRVGNLAARRDFLDVRDVVDAYVALMAKGEAGKAYNVCSGRAVAMQDLLDGLLAEAKVAIAVERDEALFRPLDVPEVVGSHAALTAATGWEPKLPIRQTLADTLGYWRMKVPFLGDAVTAMA